MYKLNNIFVNTKINVNKFKGLYKSVYKFEPGANIDQRKKADCVIVFDVLEHIYINDIKKVLFDIFNSIISCRSIGQKHDSIL